MKQPWIIGIIIYIIGFIIAILICRKLKANDDEMVIIVWLWPVVLASLLAWVMMQFPFYICKLVDVIIDKILKEDDE